MVTPPNTEAKRILSYFLLCSPINLTTCYYRMDPNLYFQLAIGMPFAVPISMILVIIRMNVFSKKRMELSPTIASLSSSIRMEKG